MSGLRRIRENVPQKEAIHQVLQHRQQTVSITQLCRITMLTMAPQVSCICIALFACEHAFRSRRPLPQMLPSPRKAFEALTRETMEALEDSPRATDVGYAIAENEVYDELIDALETLITVSRELFGTHAWLEESRDFMASFGYGRSGAETPAIQSSRLSVRRLDSFYG